MDRAANRHRFADRLHRGRQVGFGAGKFLEREFRDLGDDIIDCRLEGGRRHAGDVVVQLVQGKAHRQLGRDLGDGETRRLGRQRRGARYTRVHLDHDHAAVFGVHGPLHVRSACFHADFAQHGDRMVTHDLVFFVGQRQGRGDGDRIACVHAHRVDVLDRAYDDRVVSGVAHHFHLVFFPAKQAFVDQDLPHRRRVHPRAAVEFVIVAVISHAAAGAAHGEGRADDRGQADIFQRVERKLHACRKVFLTAGGNGRGDDGRLGVFDAQTVHRLAEELAILCHFNGFAFRADHLDVEFL